MEPQASGIKTWQWVVTAIVIIALIIIGIMVFGNKGSQVSNMNDQASTDDGTPAAGAINRIVMSDQYPGNVVYLSSVQLDQPGWVVIHKDNAGQPGDIIGQAYFDKGINPGKVTLTSPLIDGGTYYAMLHSDDGDQKFDAAKGLPIKDSKDNIIMKVFHSSSSVENSLKG